MDPIKTAMDMGLHPAVHTDCPVMPPDPLTSIWTAVTRKAKSGAVIGQTERLSVYEALLASTINAAYQASRKIRWEPLNREVGGLCGLRPQSASGRRRRHPEFEDP